LSFKFTIYALLPPALKDVIVNIFFVVFNTLLTLIFFDQKYNLLILWHITNQMHAQSFVFCSK